MKTYKKEIEQPRLVIEYDQFASNPRIDDISLGYFIIGSIDNKMLSPDKQWEYQNIVDQTANEAESQKHHMELITTAIEARGDKLLALYPVTRHEHGNVSYRINSKANGFDDVANGFYIVTEESASKLGTKPADFEEVIKGELERYSQWVNGEVYTFTLYDEQGEQIDGYGEVYSLEEIKDGLLASHEGWEDEDMRDYLITG